MLREPQSTESLVMISLQIYCNRDAISQRKTWLLPHVRSRSSQKMPKRNKNGEQEEKKKVKKKSSHQPNNKESNVYLAPKEYSSLVSIYLKTIFLWHICKGQGKFSLG